ncbi:hypothetical protein ACJJTC_014094 [Scirpophaga incertulas]
MKFLGLFLSLAAVAHCSPVSQDESVYRLMPANLMDCQNKDFGTCLKEHALKITERLRSVRKVSIFDGVTIYNNNPKEARSLDTLPTDPKQRNELVNQRLWETTADLLQRTELELSYGNEDEEESRALEEEGRGKKKKEMRKKLRVLIPLVLLAKAKAVVLVVLSIIVIAASLAKLALIAKIAFLVKAFAIIKELIAKKHAAHEEHAWAPHVEEPGQGWESGWSRSTKDANNLAYSAYRK